jgi:maltooligosyltrehalose trehalohydrolase
MRIGAHYLGENRCEFRVWAPNAEAVALEIVSPEKRLLPMQQQGEYWHLTANDIQPGTLYFYQLNNGESRPDPASNLQPLGVHGPSQVVDPNFSWNDSNWSGVPLENMIIYELHVGTFTSEGTFEAIIPRLKDLQELGVNAIEIMPIAQFPGDQAAEGKEVASNVSTAYRNWGYDGVYPFSVQISYGGPEGLKRLVEACHQQGIAIILDVVYNHFGPEGNYTNLFGPYFTDTYRTPWGSAMNFDDAHSPEVRNFFIQNALSWLRDYHIDALRLDAIHAIYDLGAKHFLAELAENVAALSQQQGRKFYLIAESDLNDSRVIREAELGGYGMDAQWSDDFHHALHTLLTGEQIGYYQDYGKCEDLAKAYSETFVYDWRYSAERKRFHGNSVKDRDPAQFVVCIQNHDQIGNRMLGERLTHLVSFEALKLAAGAVLLSPYIPLLFMGEEYGEEAPFIYFVSHGDPDLIRAVRQGRKQEFAAFHAQGEPPDPESPETFLKSKLNWEKRKEGKHQVLWLFYQHLIQLRNQIPALVKRDRQSMEVGCHAAEKILWWRRWSEQNQVLCFMNFNQHNVTFTPQLITDNTRKILDSADEKWMGSGSLLPEKLTSTQQLTLRESSFALYETP